MLMVCGGENNFRIRVMNKELVSSFADVQDEVTSSPYSCLEYIEMEVAIY